MSDEPTFWNDVLRSVLFSSAVTAAGWGALGGATSALTVRVTPKAMIRQVVLGAMVCGAGLYVMVARGRRYDAD